MLNKLYNEEVVLLKTWYKIATSNTIYNILKMLLYYYYYYLGKYVFIVINTSQKWCKLNIIFHTKIPVKIILNIFSSSNKKFYWITQYFNFKLKHIIQFITNTDMAS